jgi:acetyltransferase-like isoleucine patch superfamily enzyme
MKYFSQGGLIYGFSYLIWRGWHSLHWLLPTFLYRRVLKNCGHGTKFGKGVYIGFPKNVVIGKHVKLGEQVILNSELLEGRLIIEDRVQLSQGVVIDFTGGVEVEDDVLFSAGVKVITHDHGYDPRSKPIAYNLHIGEGAWLGLNAIVLSSVKTIGKYAIVGAGAIVTKPVPDYAIVAGNPARIIKYRSDQPPNSIRTYHEISD